MIMPHGVICLMSPPSPDDLYLSLVATARVAPGLSQAPLSPLDPPWRQLSAVGGPETSFETPAPESGECHQHQGQSDNQNRQLC